MCVCAYIYIYKDICLYMYMPRYASRAIVTPGSPSDNHICHALGGEGSLTDRAGLDPNPTPQPLHPRR